MIIAWCFHIVEVEGVICLQIRNGSKTSSLLYQGCEPSPGEELTSDSQWMWIRFESDEATTSTGFMLQYTIIDNANGMLNFGCSLS